jgi:signal transduction histidine kinase
MKESHKKLKIFFFLTLPIVVMFVYTTAFVIYMGEKNDFPVYLTVSAAIFLVVLALEVYVFESRIIRELVEVDKMKRLLVAQEMSGRLLLRRDRELTKANELLRELDERKSEFLSVVAHQLRTPLSGIKWTLNMILSGDLGPLSNDQKTFLMKGYESNQRMIGLIEDMLGADRIGSGKLRYRFARVQIMDIIDNVLYDLIQLAKKKNITISFPNRNENLAKVYIDPDKMREVVVNLVENAIKYSPEKGTITIEAVEENGFVKVTVKDQGIGIPVDQQKNIFSRFFRASNAVKVQTDGSGLGLFIVKGIIEKHGGQIWFESAEGKGSAFYFTVKIG